MLVAKIELFRFLAEEPAEELATRILRDGVDKHHSTSKSLVVNFVIRDVLIHEVSEGM